MAVQINVAANQAALTASIQAGVQAYNQKFAQNNPINLSVNQRAFSQPLGRMTGDVKDFEAALAASNARVIAFGASTAVLGGVIRSFKELANVTIDVEKNLADINRVFGLTTSQLQKFSTDLFGVGKQTASTFDDASKAALEFSRQGLKAEDVLIRTKDALTLARVAGISTANSVDALTSTVNGFAATGVTTTQILNKLVAVEQDFAVGAGDLAEALSRTGQAAQEAGVSLDQLNALVTAAQQSTARGGAVIGNALKTIFTRLQRTETLDQLEAFNIAVRDVQGNTLPAVTVLQNFAGAYKNLGDAQRAQLSEQVAGVYQVNILKAIVGDLNKSQGVYAGALQRGASATNEAEVATAKLNQTLDALLKQTATSTQQLANNIGKVTFEPLARYGTEQLKSLVESMSEILEGEGIGSTFANGLLKGIRNIIAGPGAIAAFFTLFKLIQNSFTYLAQALPQIAGITTETQNRKNIEQSILQIMQQQGPVSQALAGTMGNQAAQAQLLLELARQQTAEYQMQSTLAKQLATQLAGQGVRVKGSGGLQATRAGGYIPNATRMAEAVGAQAGGYAPGKVVKSPVGGVMNTAEDVKYVPGFAQPFINPPAGSKAGRAHRQNAISRTGVDPYTAGGFIPNFAKKSIRSLGQQSLNNLYDVGDRVGNTTFYDKYDDQELIKTFNLPYTYEEYRLKAAYAYDNASKIYQKEKDKDIGLAKANEYLKKVTGGYSQALEKKYFDQPDTSPAERHLNKIAGGFGEKDTAEIFSKHTKLINAVGPDFKKIIKNRVSFIETKVRKNDVPDEVLLEKFLRGYAKTSLPVLFKRNGDEDVISAKFGTLIHAIAAKTPDTKSLGFIPNFAPPTSAIRVPWFKKFGNASFDAVQPTLGISKASDTDVFRQIGFRSTATGADKNGDNNIFAPLYEDFVFKAMQLVSHPDIRDDLMRGYVLQPGTNQKQSALDAVYRKKGVGVEYKGYPKKNLTGSLGGELTRKYEALSKTNPEEAAKLQELIIAFNEVGHENQLPSEFGKTFSQLAGTSYSQILKNSPGLVKGLSAETNSLLNNYVKNPAFLAMNAAKGFLPNFADPKIKTNSGKDAVESFYRKGSEVDGKELTGGVMAFPVPQTTDLYSVGSSRVSIPGSGFGIPLYDAVLAEVSKRGAWLTSDRLTVSDKARRIWDGYRKLRTGDVKNKKLPMKNWFLDPAFNNGSYEFPMNPQDLLKNKSTWPSEKDPVWSLQHAYQFKKSQLNDKMSSGFIPNFNYNDIGLDALTSKLGREGAISQDLTQFVIDLKNQKYAMGDGFHREIIAKNFGEIVTDEELSNPKNANTYLKGSYDKNSGKTIFYKSFAQSMLPGKLFESKHPYIQTVQNELKSRFAKRQASAPVKRTELPLSERFRRQHPGPSPDNHFNNGFIPNFANQDFEILREIIRLNKLGAISNNRYTSSEEDDKNNITRLYRGVKGISERWNSIDKNNPQAINKAIFEKQSGNKIMNEKGFVNKSFSNLAFSHRLNWPDETENPIPFLSTSKKEDVADMFATPSGLKGSIAIKNSRLLGNEKRYENLYKKYGKEKVKGILYKLSKTGGGKGLGLDFVDAYNSGNAYKGYGNEGEIGLFSRGFIPNLANFIDVDTLGKNPVHYSGNLMELIKDIESSIGRHLTSGELRALTNPKANLSKLNDPKVLNKFINSESKGGFAGFAKGFLPNFNPIKGRNSFQKNWLIETAKKRNLNLNDPDVFSELARQFAKIYPNDQGMFGLSEGFLPNFAYKQAVMGLEESMSGNKAVFDSKPFPHIRNKSQPTFSSAIADHGGLGNALSDSMRGQKNAGLMSKGYVPNFARKARVPRVGSLNLESMDPSIIDSRSGTGSPVLPNNVRNGLIRSVNDLIKQYAAGAIDQTKLNDGVKALSSRYQLTQQSQQKLQTAVDKQTSGITAAANNSGKFAKSLSSASTTVAIAGPMLAGQIESAVFGNKKRTDMSDTERQVQSGLSTGLTAASTGASIGAAFGPWGAAVGLAVGATIGLAQSLGAASLSADELSQVASEYKSKTQDNISTAQTYIDTLKTLNTSTDPEIIKKASESLAENFSNIKDVNLQEIFKNTGTDVKKLGAALDQYEKGRKKIQNEADEDTKAALGKGSADKSVKQLSELGYNKTRSLKTLVRDFTYLIPSKENDNQILSDFKQTFEDLSVLTEEKAKQFQTLVEEEKAKGIFDTERVANFLKDEGISEGTSERLAARFDELEEDSNLIGGYLIDGLSRLFGYIKTKTKKEKETSKTPADVFVNDFLSLKRQLTLTLSDSLIKVSDSIRQYEFDTSITNLISGKMKEINDSIYSSISGNLSDLGAINAKSSQLNYTNLFQASEVSKGRGQITETTRLKKAQNTSSYEDKVAKTIFGAEGGVKRNPETMNLIYEFISGSLNKSRSDFESFAKNLGVSAESAFALSKDLEADQKSLSDLNADLDNNLKLKTKEFDLTEIANKINYETGLKQLELEKEKLKITYAQKDATLQLRKDTESYKITSGQALELKKIDIGSEFRYLGSGKRETFTSQQTDQKSIFDDEQKIAQKQAILDARKSIIEIATQEANTAAQDANTNAILDLIDVIVQNKINEGFGIMSNASTPEEIKRGKSIYDQGMQSEVRNSELRTASNERKNKLSYSKLSDLGVTNEMSIEQAMAQLNNSKVGKDQSTVNAIDNTIQDLKTASETLGSSATVYAAKVAQAKADFEKSSGFTNNMVIGFKNLGKEADEMVDQLGRNLPGMFADGLVDGIKAAIRESDNLESALMGIASKFLDEISTTLMKAGIRNILSGVGFGDLIGGLTGNQKGGYIRAQSGMYISGTGTGDKYPAMLENGEYVLNRRAVMAMGGPASLDTLNFSAAPRFASGGTFKKEFNDISSMEANMTEMGLENDPYYNELNDAAKQKAQEDRAKKLADKQQKAAMIGSLVAAAATIAIGAGISNIASNAQATKAQAMSTKLTGKGSNPLMMSGKEFSQLQKFQSSGLITSGGSYIGGNSFTGFKSMLSKPTYGETWYQKTGSTLSKPFRRKQTGGLIGSRLSDTIPGYMEGGLYDSPMVKRYGTGMQSGGSPISSTGNSNSTVNNNTNANNSFNFNTSVQRDGSLKMGSNTTSYEQQDVELSKNLNNKIYAAVGEVIRKEKQFGGSLAGVRT